MPVPASFLKIVPVILETVYTTPFDLRVADGKWEWLVCHYPPFQGEQFVNEKDPLIYMRWYERVYSKDDQGNEAWWHERRELKLLGQDMKDSLASPTGSQFFKTWFIATIKNEPFEPNPKTNGLTMESSCTPTFEWTFEGDLLLNTTNVDSQRQVARVLWGQTLPLKMGWIEEVSTGNFRLGPNLLQEFHSDTIPTPDEVPDANNQPTFWKVDGGYLVLSVTCNWCFVRLNEKFRPSTEFASTCPLHVYCNVGTSSMVGNRVTDLLREIKYHSQNTPHFEPIHIQYLPVRNELVEIVDTQMAEIIGDLAQFGEGHTNLTLHFKREVV